MVGVLKGICGCLFLWWCMVSAEFQQFDIQETEDVKTVSSFDCVNVTDVSSGECQALIDLYISTHGEDWVHTDNRIGSGDETPTTVCDWYGIQCDNGLYALHLEENNLSWYIPTSFRTLSDFSLVYLRNNTITTIENGAFKSSRLQELNLLNNQLSSITDTTFSELINLKELYLSYNHLQNIPNNSFSGLHNLITLDLSHNQLNAIESGAFLWLDTLRYLSLANNQLTLIDNATFTGLQNIRELYLSYNQLTTIDVAIFTGLNSLEALYLSNNRLNSFSFIPTVSSLQNLDMRYNCLSEGNVNAEEYGWLLYIPQSQTGCLWSWSTENKDLSSLEKLTQSWGWGSTYKDRQVPSFVTMRVKDIRSLLKTYIPHLPSKTRFERLLAKKPALYEQIISFLSKKLR